MEYAHKTNYMKIFSNSKTWWNILVWLSDEIAEALVIFKEHAHNQRKSRKNGSAIEEMQNAIYHDKDSKTYWNDYLK